MGALFNKWMVAVARTALLPRPELPCTLCGLKGQASSLSAGRTAPAGGCCKGLQ